MAPPIGKPSVSTVQQRMRKSVDELLEADRKNPDIGTTPPPGQLPNAWHLSGPGWNGEVDKKEAATTGKTAQAMWGAAVKTWAPKQEVGGFVDGKAKFIEVAGYKGEATGSELREMQRHAERIVASMGDADGNIPESNLQPEAIRSTVASYLKATFDGRERVTNDEVDAIVKLVQTAVAGD